LHFPLIYNYKVNSKQTITFIQLNPKFAGILFRRAASVEDDNVAGDTLGGVVRTGDAGTGGGRVTDIVLNSSSVTQGVVVVDVEELSPWPGSD